MEDLNLSDSRIAGLVLRAATNKMVERLQVFKYLALILMWLGVIAAGIGPVEYPWLRVGLAGLLVIAYIATLYHLKAEKKE